MRRLVGGVEGSKEAREGENADMRYPSLRALTVDDCSFPPRRRSMKMTLCASSERKREEKGSRAGAWSEGMRLMAMASFRQGETSQKIWREELAPRSNSFFLSFFQLTNPFSPNLHLSTTTTFIISSPPTSSPSASSSTASSSA